MNGILDGLLAILGFCYYALLALWAFVSQVLLPVLSIALLVIAFLLVAVVMITFAAFPMQGMTRVMSVRWRKP